MVKKLDFEYVKQCVESQGCKLISNSFDGTRTNIMIEFTCGHQHGIVLSNFKKRIPVTVCPKCTPKVNKLTDEEMAEKLLPSGFLLLGVDIIDGHSWVNAEDIETGYRYYNFPYRIIIRRIHPFNSTNPHRVYNLSLWARKNDYNVEIKEVFNDFRFLKNKQMKAVLICNLCHREWDATLNNVMKKTECPYCSGRFPTETNNFLYCFPEIVKDWDYIKNSVNPSKFTIGSKQKVWWKCHICGCEWKATINNRTREDGTRCPECVNDSKGEIRIRKYLKHNSISYIPQYSFKGCRNKNVLPFDFAIFEDYACKNLLCLIEFDGAFHYVEKHEAIYNDKYSLSYIQNNDKIKTEYCRVNGIKLIRIPYWEKSNIEIILNKELKLLERR